VLIAFVIAVPCSYWMMGKWLEGYAYRTTISWWIFPLAGGLALSIAFITVSSQLLKAVLTAPIKSIKTE
jgi:putative ABC transport system permease protein